MSTSQQKPPIWAHAALVATAFVFATPIVWMVLTSFKPAEQITGDPHRVLPAEWCWQNYVDAVSTVPYFQYLKNSLVLCTMSVIGTLASCSVVAYGFSRLRWRGRDACFFVLIATMLLPWHVTMVPRFVLLSELGLYNSLAALIAPTFLGDAFSIFLLRQFFLTIPEELSEAARLDGCSEWGVFWRIVLPLSKPALATLGIFVFLFSWNNFLWPLLVINSLEMKTLPLGLAYFLGQYTIYWNLLMVGATITLLPVLIVFFFAQRYFIEGITLTGLKG
jgi:multiple sugar transport system permease protein